METKEYFEKVMQDFNQNRRGRNLRKYCSDEGIDYKWLSEYKKQYSFHRDPTVYGEAFIFYNKKYDTVKILHYDLNGYVIYQKWFDDGKMLKPKFMEIKSCHLITREQVTLLVSNAVQSKMYIYDE